MSSTLLPGLRTKRVNDDDDDVDDDDDDVTEVEGGWRVDTEVTKAFLDGVAAESEFVEELSMRIGDELDEGTRFTELNGGREAGVYDEVEDGAEDSKIPVDWIVGVCVPVLGAVSESAGDVEVEVEVEVEVDVCGIKTGAADNGKSVAMACAVTEVAGLVGLVVGDEVGAAGEWRITTWTAVSNCGEVDVQMETGTDGDAALVDGGGGKTRAWAGGVVEDAVEVGDNKVPPGRNAQVVTRGKLEFGDEVEVEHE